MTIRLLLTPILLAAACGSSGNAPPTAPSNTSVVTADASADDPAWESKIADGLREHMRTAKATDRIAVSLWLDVDILVGPAKEPMPVYKDYFEDRIRHAANEAQELLASLGIVYAGSLSGAPLVFAEATPDQIRALAKRTEFVRIDFNDTTGIDDAES
jgi:hypothetical protein